MVLLGLCQFRVDRQRRDLAGRQFGMRQVALLVPSMGKTILEMPRRVSLARPHAVPWPAAPAARECRNFAKFSGIRRGGYGEPPRKT